MVCLFACFGAGKHRKSRHLVNATHLEDRGDEVTEALQLVESSKKEVSATAEPKENIEEPFSNIKKKVAFVLNVKTQEGEVIDNLGKNNEKKKGDDLVESNDKKEYDYVLVNNSEGKEGDDLVKSDENINVASEKDEKTPKSIKLVSDVNAITPSHRHQNRAISEVDKYADLDFNLEESDLSDGIGSVDVGCAEQKLVQEESSESFFSLSIESRKQVREVELGEMEVNSPMPKCGGGGYQELEEIRMNENARDRSQHVHSELNPVENVTQWKTVKGREIPPSKYQEKENINLTQDLEMAIYPEPSLKTSKLKSNAKKVADGEIAVDTSLSSWLAGSETTPMPKSSTISVGNSQRPQEDKAILRALTVKEANQLSASASVVSPRGSRRPMKYEIGTVGSYWSHTRRILASIPTLLAKECPNQGS